MKVHHLNCTSLYPRISGSFAPPKFICHVLLLETNSGIVLVDSGISTYDMKNPKELGLIRTALKFSTDLKESALEQVQKLGFKPSDVTHIITTHLDMDHAGGILDFPHVRVHTTDLELSAARSRKSFIQGERYKDYHIDAIKDPIIYDHTAGEAWNTFSKVQKVQGLSEEIYLVPLPGHTKGHYGVALQDDQGNWLLHCGDAYYDKREITKETKVPRGVRLFGRVAHSNYKEVMKTQKKIAQFKKENTHFRVFCSHDYSEFENLSQGSSQENS